MTVESGGALPWDTIAPVVGQLGFGGLLGWAVGFTVKKSLKLAAIVAGVLFIGIQALVSLGYIDPPHWPRINADLSRLLDKSHFEAFWAILTRSLPFGGGFTVGFLLGFSAG